MLTSNSFYLKIAIPKWLTNTRGTLSRNFLCKFTNNTLDTTSDVLIKISSLTINHILFYLTISSPKILQQCMSKLQNRIVKQYKTFIMKP